ncbi:MAG: DUF4383 domain-containing protein [Pseudonocardiaceae bacterium]
MRSPRNAQIVLVGQALLLGGLAVAGLSTAAGSPAVVAGLQLNTPHSVLLLATAGASVLAAVWVRVARAVALTQAVVYTLVFLIGTPASAGRPQDTWLALNTPDHFLHLGLALLGGVLGTAVLLRPAALPEAQEDSTDHPTPRESEETRDMIAAEVAVTEGHATDEQVRRLQDDAQRRADAERHRAWQQFTVDGSSGSAPGPPGTGSGVGRR